MSEHQHPPPAKVSFMAQFHVVTEPHDYFVHEITARADRGKPCITPRPQARCTCGQLSLDWIAKP